MELRLPRLQAGPVFWLGLLSKANNGRQSLRLRGLDEKCAYSLKIEDRPLRVVSGSELMSRGLPLLPSLGDGASLCIELSAEARA